MSQLFFKKRFQDVNRANQKTTTIRRWAKPLLQEGQQAFCPGLGWLAIEAVEVIQLEDLGDDDANSDGFPTAAEMKRLLQELYPSYATDRSNGSESGSGCTSFTSGPTRPPRMRRACSKPVFILRDRRLILYPSM